MLAWVSSLTHGGAAYTLQVCRPVGSVRKNCICHQIVFMHTEILWCSLLLVLPPDLLKTMKDSSIILYVCVTLHWRINSAAMQFAYRILTVCSIHI